MDKDNVMIQSRHLKKLVEDLTTSGKQTLNEDQVKSLKKICKSSDYFIMELFHILMKQLKRKHSEIRLSTFQIFNEIFVRSHCFRELVLKNFRTIIELTITYDSPLKPIPAARKLRTIAIEAIHSWYEKFKEGYTPLKLGYKYLKECKQVDFEGLTVITEQDRQRRAEERRKEEEIKNRRVQKVVNEMEEKSSEFSNIILEFSNTFKLLIPDLDNFFIPLEEENTNNTFCFGKKSTDNFEEESFEFGSDVMREHGLTKETTVQVNLSNIHKVQETPDNEVIICTLQEQISNIKKNIFPEVREWEQSVMQYSASESELIRKIIDLKTALESVIARYATVIIVPQVRGKVVDKTISKSSTSELYSSDDDDDFIDVPFDDPRVLQATASENALFGTEDSSFREAVLKSIDSSDLEAAGSSRIHKIKDKTSNSPNKIMDLNVDTFFNEEWETPLKIHNTMTDLSNKWSANEALHDYEEDVVKPSDILGIATRAVDFEREWEPVRWECRAPLPTGRLCPRKDRERCPLHGVVIPRDNLGVPVKPEDIRKEQQRLEEYERRNPAWQNPILLAEIRASTGVDLDMKKVKKRKRKYPNLTDIKTVENTPRSRLQKKVLGKKSLRRINKALVELPQ